MGAPASTCSAVNPTARADSRLGQLFAEETGERRADRDRIGSDHGVPHQAGTGLTRAGQDSGERERAGDRIAADHGVGFGGDLVDQPAVLDVLDKDGGDGILARSTEPKRCC